MKPVQDFQIVINLLHQLSPFMPLLGGGSLLAVFYAMRFLKLSPSTAWARRSLYVAVLSFFPSSLFSVLFRLADEHQVPMSIQRLPRFGVPALFVFSVFFWDVRHSLEASWE